jgi:dipeptidyl aminopeptidase/acylaminoacyl peptidase
MRGLVAVLLAALVACHSTSPTEPPIEMETGSIRLTVSTTGPGAPATVLLFVDGAPPTSIPANGAQVIAGLVPGEHTVRLEVPGACTSARFAPLPVVVEDDATTPASWTIACPPAAPPGVYFERRRNGPGAEIWRADPDGTNPVRIPTPYESARPAPNPSRTRIAWNVDYEGGELMVMNVDGTNLRATRVWATAFDWSPDGTALAASDGRGLLLLWPDGTPFRTLREGEVTWLRWSPDGSRIAYRSGAYLYVIEVLSGARINSLYAFADYYSGAPAWSPDGTRLAFVDLTRKQLVTMRPDGTEIRVVDTGEFGPLVEWMGTGSLLHTRVVAGSPTYREGLYVIPAAGGTPTVFIPSVEGVRDVAPRWAP